MKISTYLIPTKYKPRKIKTDVGIFRLTACCFNDIVNNLNLHLHKHKIIRGYIQSNVAEISLPLLTLSKKIKNIDNSPVEKNNHLLLLLNCNSIHTH